MNPKNGIDVNHYYAAKFENFDRYSSEDYIYGTINNTCNIKMCDVHTQEEYIDSDGDKKTNTLFRGLFAMVESKHDFSTPITVHTNQGLFGKLFNKKNKIEMDSSRFEDYFDVHAENKIVAMQILTSDVMNLMVDFIEKYSIDFEITLRDKIIYIRFKTGNMFEANISKSALDKNTLFKYYSIINFTFNLCKTLNNEVNQTEI